MEKPVRLAEVFLAVFPCKGEVSYQGGALKWKFRIAWKQFLADQPEQAAPPVSRTEEKHSQSKTLKSPPSEKSIQKKESSEQLKKQPEPIQKKTTEHKKTENKRNRIQDRDLESGFLKKRNR